MATAIGKLGFVAYPAGRSFTLLVLNWLLFLTHLLDLVLVRLKLLVQFPAGKRKGERLERQELSFVSPGQNTFCLLFVLFGFSVGA